jgi:LacI family transcriptional regulator
MTIGVLGALQRKGMLVPRDMCVVAYDDIDPSDVFHPRLTVIGQPVSEIANMAVKLLIGRITNGNEHEAPRRIRYPGIFVHRESCGCDADPPPVRGASASDDPHNSAIVAAQNICHP